MSTTAPTTPPTIAATGANVIKALVAPIDCKVANMPPATVKGVWTAAAIDPAATPVDVNPTAPITPWPATASPVPATAPIVAPILVALSS